MKLNAWALSLSAGLVTATAFTICAFFVALAPEVTAAFLGYLFHIDLTGLTRAISWDSFLAGLLFSGLGMALSAAVAAGLYNRLI